MAVLLELFADDLKEVIDGNLKKGVFGHVAETDYNMKPRRTDPPLDSDSDNSDDYHTGILLYHGVRVLTS